MLLQCHPSLSGCGLTAIMMKSAGYSATSCIIVTYIMDHLLEVHINIKGKTQSTFIKKADESAYSAIIAKDVVNNATSLLPDHL